MLLVIENKRELNMGNLLCVYEEYIRQRARKAYPQLDENLAILEAEQELYTYCADFLRERETVITVWSENRRYVSALRAEPYRDGVLLTAIETAPACRRKGYAACLLKETVNFLQAEGVGKIYSHIRSDNLPSVNLHLQCGFRKISDGAVLLDGSADSKMCTYLRIL